MVASSAVPLQSERRNILVVLIALSIAGWIVVLWQAAAEDDHGDMAMGGMDGGFDLTAGMSAPLFLAMWVAMMIGMMFPASAPMIVAFARAQQRKREQGASHIPTWLFVAPYMAIWLLFGAAGYGAALAADAVVADSSALAGDLSRVAAGGLVVAGLYQLTPLKRVCLAKCRSPMSFMLSYWRDGRVGAVQLAARHGLYCVGCCWVLFAVLLPLGVMNVAAMALVAALVFAEKVLPRGERVSTVAAIVLIAYGSFALAVPNALPTSV